VSASHVIWYTARAGGFTALLLLTLSMAIGMALGLRLHSPRWPRYVTTELHRFVTLTALVFVGIHSAAIAADPYMHFRLVDVLVPFAGSYRPLGMALGITASYLLLALWISSLLQRQIGWRSWRTLHYAAFAAYAFSVVHTILVGSDASSEWARWSVLASVAVVGGLAGLRFLGEREGRSRPSSTPT
jgi:predicted ferric reductase